MKACERRDAEGGFLTRATDGVNQGWLHHSESVDLWGVSKLGNWKMLADVLGIGSRYKILPQQKAKGATCSTRRGQVFISMKSRTRSYDAGEREGHGNERESNTSD